MSKRDGAITAVIKETNIIEGNPCSAWFVRHRRTLYGQYHSEPEAIGKAMELQTVDFGQRGEPLDASAIKERIVFENNTAFRNPKLVIGEDLIAPGDFKNGKA